MLPLALAMVACTPAPTTPAPVAPEPVGFDVREVTDTTMATPSGMELLSPRPGLYSAGQPAPGDWSTIAARGVGTVINMRTADEMDGRDEAAEVRAAGMDYLELPIDGAGAVTAENARVLARMLEGIEGPVLVHCASANRSGGLLALMAAREEGMDDAQALAFGRDAGMRGTEERVRTVLACDRIGEDGLASC